MRVTSVFVVGRARWGDTARSKTGERVRGGHVYASAPPSRGPRGGYWQVLNLKEWMCVLQLNVPLAGMNSPVKTNVQSSTGSTLMVL